MTPYSPFHGSNFTQLLPLTERLALKWIQKYVGAFGGDPTKVTLYVIRSLIIDRFHSQRLINRWGESAGAISVAMQMLVNGGNTEGLFRAGFMQSGATIPVGGMENGQKCKEEPN